MPKDIEPKVSAVVRAQAQINIMVSQIDDWANNQSPEEAIASMALPYFEAESFGQMFEQQSSIEPRLDLMDIGLMIEAVSFNKSDYAEGLPYYATFHGYKLIDTPDGQQRGDDFVTNCGGWQTVVVAYRCRAEGWLPRAFCFHRADKPTKRGFYPVSIFPWGDSAEEPF